MKFIIITTYDSYVIEADDFEDALSDAYNNHYGYNHINGIIRIPEED